MKTLTTAEKIEYLWQSKAPLSASLAGVLRHHLGYEPPSEKATSNVAGDNGFFSTLAKHSRRKKELVALPPCEIDQLYALVRNSELYKEEKRRSYNQPRAQADFLHWAMLPYWTVDETAALLLGKNPEVVKASNLEKFKYDDELADLERGSLKIMSLDAMGKLSFSKQYKGLFALVQRSKIFLPDTQNVDPVSAVGMAKASGISIPAPLEAALAGRKPRPVQALATAPATVITPEPQVAPVVAVGASGGTVKVWTTERKEAARAMMNKQRGQGMKAFAANTAVAFGVTPTRLREVLNDKPKKAPTKKPKGPWDV